jgi:hypothetical protein
MTSSDQVQIDFTKNAFVKRVAKALIVLATMLVNVANVWLDGPQWLYVAANVAALLLTYYVPNAPTFKDPRANYLRASDPR